MKRAIAYLTGASCAALMLPQAVLAQAAAPAAIPAPVADEGIKDIVVTAQRRSENVQRSSLSISVVTPDTLARLGVTQATEITKLVPGVQIGGNTTPQIYIRGVGDFGVTAITNPGVAVNLDGVYIARPQGIAGNFYDLERIEVLKGPQGTLYGRNANGGAINILAAKPDLDEAGMSANFEVGNYDAILADAAVNLPVSSTFGVRFSGQVANRDGYLSDGSDDDVHQSLRARALWKPNDRVSLLFGGEYNHFGGAGQGYALRQPAPGVSGNLPGTGKFTGFTDPVVQAYYGSLTPGLLQTSVPSDINQNNVFWSVFAQLDVDLGFATLTVLPAYQDTRLRYTTIPSFIFSTGGEDANSQAYNVQGDTSKATSVEVRLGNDGERLKWVIGGYFFNEDQTSNYRVRSGFLQDAIYASDLGSRAFAGFGQAAYEVFDGFRLIGGARYTTDRRSLTNGALSGVFPSLSCLPAVPPPNGVCPLTTFGGRKTFSKATWKAGFELDLAASNMLYGSVSTGFKAGGFNQAIAPGTTNSTLAYDPENLTAYTLGIRNRLLDNRLQINLEGFYWKYKDIQVNHLIIDGAGQVSLANQNAGSGRAYGASGDVVFKPLRNTTLRAGVEFNDTKYDRFVYYQATAFVPPGSVGCPVTPSDDPSLPAAAFSKIDCSGQQFIRAPKWSGNVGIEQTIDIGDGELTIAGDMVFASSRWTAAEFIAAERAGAYQIYNASLTYAPQAGISITGFIRNISDREVPVSGFQSPFIPGLVTNSVQAPRTYGVRLGFKI